MSSERRPFSALLAAGALFAAVPAAAAPEIREWTTSNGARVMFIEAHEIPAVDVRITFAAGAARDGEHPGIARLTSNLLMSGTDELDADALARAWEDQGAQVSTGAERDMAWAEVRSLSEDEHLQPVIRTVARMLAHPAFPPDEIARLKDQQRTALEEEEQSPGALAQRAFWETVYGDHPYGHEPLGTRASLEAIDRAAIRAFHERYYVAANANIAIVGDLSRERAERLARTLVEPLPAGEPAPALPPVPELDEDVTVRREFPSTQAHVLIGQPGVARGYARWPALYVANHVFGGGGFTSRLFGEVRERRGMVYGIFSYASPMEVRGPFLIRLQTRGDQAAEAIDIVRAELRRFVDEGPTEAEVEDAVRNVTGGFPLQIDSNSELASYLSMMGYYRLPTDYLERFPEAAAAVDARAAHAAFTDTIGDRRRVTVIVGGDRAQGAAE